MVNGGSAYLEALVTAGYRAVSVSGTREAISHRPRPDAVILELLVPEDDLASLRTWPKSRRTRALTVIALAGEERRAAILQAGATFCRFPCPPAELVAVVQQVLPLPD
jgi:DNA-binding response OmpR family regulator